MARILIVDDEAAILDVLVDFCTLIGHEPVAVTSVDAAMQAASASAFDLALTDLHMPGQTGFDLERRLHELSPDLPIICISGSMSESRSDELDNSGFAMVLGKPIDFPRLRAVIDSLLGTGS